MQSAQTQFATMSTKQYFRVKREFQTLFISVNKPKEETVLNLKEKICQALLTTQSQEASDFGVSLPSQVQLQVTDKVDSSKYVVLVDALSVEAAGLIDQQVIVMTWKTKAGQWEPITIKFPESLVDMETYDEDEEIEPPRASKGKERA